MRTEEWDGRRRESMDIDGEIKCRENEFIKSIMTREGRGQRLQENDEGKD